MGLGRVPNLAWVRGWHGVVKGPALVGEEVSHAWAGGRGLLGTEEQLALGKDRTGLEERLCLLEGMG